MTMVEEPTAIRADPIVREPDAAWVKPDSIVAAPVPGKVPGARRAEPASPAAVAVAISNLNLFYGKNQALRDISLEIPEKQVTAFIGPSGCGKSTLLRCLNRMNDLIDTCRVEGSIRIHGREIYSLRIDGIRNRSLLEETVERALKSAGLWEEVKDRLHTSALALSGGQQQRLCIARAIAAEPEVLLMDEPCSALDPIATNKIEQLMESLREQVTIVIVTHNMHQAARVADRTAFFYLGHLIEAGPTSKIFNTPDKEQTADYVMGRFG